MRTIYVAAVCFLMASAAIAEPPLGVTDLQQLLENNDFHGAVAGASRLLNFAGPGSTTIDRGFVLAIKGEGQLQLRNYQMAAQAFASAAKEEGDPARAAVYKANEILINRSTAGVYVPRVAGVDNAQLMSIDILPRENRLTAYPVLFRDEWSVSQIELKLGRSTHDLAQLLQIVEKANMLRQLELAASGKDNQTKEPIKAISDHAFEVVTSMLAVENQRVTDDKAEAEKKVHTQKLEIIVESSRHPSYAANVQHVRTAGLSNRLIRDLQSIVNDCQRIPPVAESIGRLSDVDKKWGTVVAETERVSGRAKDVLDADYDTADKHDETLLGR